MQVLSSRIPWPHLTYLSLSLSPSSESRFLTYAHIFLPSCPCPCHCPCYCFLAKAVSVLRWTHVAKHRWPWPQILPITSTPTSSPTPSLFYEMYFKPHAYLENICFLYLLLCFSLRDAAYQSIDASQCNPIPLTTAQVRNLTGSIPHLTGPTSHLTGRTLHVVLLCFLSDRFVLLLCYMYVWSWLDTDCHHRIGDHFTVFVLCMFFVWDVLLVS